jgi:hypothetical protein
MSVNWPKPTHNHVQEYQVSAWPWVTSSNVATSAVQFNFGFVTRWVMVTNDDGSSGSKDIYFGFTENGVNGGNHFHVHPGATVGPIEVKCTSIWAKSDQSGGAPLSIMAGLTNVAAGDFPVISGSNGFGGVG